MHQQARSCVCKKEGRRLHNVQVDVQRLAGWQHALQLQLGPPPCSGGGGSSCAATAIIINNDDGGSGMTPCGRARAYNPAPQPAAWPPLC